MTLDPDIAKKVASIRKAIMNGAPCSADDITEDAANNLMLLEQELHAARAFYKSIKSGIEALGRTVI